VNLYLTPELQAHRRGRFLASLLAITPSSEQVLPEAGFVLMIGEQLQASPELQAECISWARRPGCTLLLLPPYKEGRIFPYLDWVIDLISLPLANAQSESLESILAGELSHRLQGMDGTCTTAASMGDLACHIRYWKAYANSGLIAATTLPLWSISLLDHADKVSAFLAELDKHTGTPSATTPKDEPQEEDLRPHDVSVLVCCYGFDLATLEGLSERLHGYMVPFLNLASFDLPETFNRLRRRGFLDDKGLTETGLALLRASKYWTFAENLREMPSL
jgi:hypothetical protein